MTTSIIEGTARTVPQARPRRWDPLVRLIHWSVVAAIVANGLFTEGGSGVHVWIGYGLAAMLALRLLWGLVGPPEARFSAFPPSPRRAIAHVRDIFAGVHRDHVSHNPLGALMAYAIWACLAVIVATGIAMAGLPGTAGDAGHAERAAAAESGRLGPREAVRGDEDEEQAGEREEGGEAGEREEGPLGEIHEAAVNFLYLLIALHLAGVIFETRRSGAQVVRAMLPGRR